MKLIIVTMKISFIDINFTFFTGMYMYIFIKNLPNFLYKYLYQNLILYKMKMKPPVFKLKLMNNQ